MASLAARDYFFDTPLKRAYFENFTNLIPMDRHGTLRESLRLAGEALQQGYNLLIFPEGTRSPDGQMREFKPTLGYLALTYGVDILPAVPPGHVRRAAQGQHAAEAERDLGPHRPGARHRGAAPARARASPGARATGW